MLKKATTSFCLFDESHFSNIRTHKYVTIECIEIDFAYIGKESETAKLLFQ